MPASYPLSTPASPPDHLVELDPAAPLVAGLQRRWFTSATMDLIVWLDEEATLRAFQLCYGKPLDEYALQWRQDTGFSHVRVDDGGVAGIGHKRTPVMGMTAAAPTGTLRQQLEDAGARLPVTLLAALRAHLERLEEESRD